MKEGLEPYRLFAYAYDVSRIPEKLFEGYEKVLLDPGLYKSEVWGAKGTNNGNYASGYLGEINHNRCCNDSFFRVIIKRKISIIFFYNSANASKAVSM